MGDGMTNMADGLGRQLEHIGTDLVYEGNGLVDKIVSGPVTAVSNLLTMVICKFGNYHNNGSRNLCDTTVQGISNDVADDTSGISTSEKAISVNLPNMSS